jgi:hypothetical protein
LTDLAFRAFRRRKPGIRDTHIRIKEQVVNNTARRTYRDHPDEGKQGSDFDPCETNDIRDDKLFVSE